MRREIEEYYSEDFNYATSVNWQVLTNQLVHKFGPILMSMNQSYTRYEESSKSTEEYEFLARNVSSIGISTVRRFIDFGHEDKSNEVRREDALKQFVYQYSNPIGKGLKSKADHLIWSSVAKVTELVFLQLLEQFDFSNLALQGLYNNKDKGLLPDEAIEKHRESLKSLLNLFDWAFFYKCPRQCGWNEVCYAPTWGPSPHGWNSRDDYSRITADAFVCLDIFSN